MRAIFYLEKAFSLAHSALLGAQKFFQGICKGLHHSDGAAVAT
jgi:hypothetical protein